MGRLEEGEEEKVIGVIVSTITAYLHPKRILLFGSRERGRGKRYSDFDVALEGVAMTHRGGAGVEKMKATESTEDTEGK